MLFYEGNVCVLPVQKILLSNIFSGEYQRLLQDMVEWIYLYYIVWQICCCMPIFWKPYSVLHANIILCYLLSLTLTLLASLVDSSSFFVYLNLLTWISIQHLIIPLMFCRYLDQIYQHFYAFILDNNFCFFEHAHEFVTHVNIPDFIHRIYNDSKPNSETSIWSWAILH